MDPAQTTAPAGYVDQYRNLERRMYDLERQLLKQKDTQTPRLTLPYGAARGDAMDADGYLDQWNLAYTNTTGLRIDPGANSHHGGATGSILVPYGGIWFVSLSLAGISPGDGDRLFADVHSDIDAFQTDAIYGVSAAGGLCSLTVTGALNVSAGEVIWVYATSDDLTVRGDLTVVYLDTGPGVALA